MTDLDRMIAIAQVVRNVFEEISTLENGEDDLCGYCLRASLQLVRVAQSQGIKAEIAQNEGHTFALFEGMIIDPTATQFGVEEKVMVIPLEELWNDPTWKILFRSYDPFAAAKRWNGECNCLSCWRMRETDPAMVDEMFKLEHKESLNA